MFPDRLSCRQVLNIMVILGFMLNYMLRVNLTIAIVSMVTTLPNNDSHAHSNESMDECGVRIVTMTASNVTPIDDGRAMKALIADVDVNRINEANSSAPSPAFPQRHSVRCDLCKAELISRLTTPSLVRAHWTH